MGSTDLDLLHRARWGENAAFHELIDRHGAALFRLAFLLVGSESDAEDVVQETLLGAFRNLKTFKGHASVKTWLTRILARQAAMQRRKRARWRMVSLEGAGDEAGSPRPVSDAESGARQADARLDVQAVLGAVSPEHRQVILLREFEGMSYREISDVLDVPCGTVESRLFRARQQLKSLFEGYP